MKSLFRAFLFTVFFVSFFALTSLMALKYTFLSPNYLKNKLAQADFYNRAHDAIPEIVAFITPDGTTTEEADQNTISADRLGKIILNGTTSEILKTKTEGFLDDFYQYLSRDDSPEKLAIKINDILPKLKIAEADQAGVALEFLNSGDFGIKYPDSIDVPVPPEIRQFGFISRNFTLLVMVSSVLTALGLVTFGLTKKGGWEYKVHSVGEALFWSSFITAMFFGFFWLFFTAGNLIYREFSGGLRISETNITYFYKLIVSMVDDFERIIMISCASLLTVGLIGWVVGKIYIKKNQKPIKLEETPARI
jgi:hypothetical protein